MLCATQKGTAFEPNTVSYLAHVRQRNIVYNMYIHIYIFKTFKSSARYTYMLSHQQNVETCMYVSICIYIYIYIYTYHIYIYAYVYIISRFLALLDSNGLAVVFRDLRGKDESSLQGWCRCHNRRFLWNNSSSSAGIPGPQKP